MSWSWGYRCARTASSFDPARICLNSTYELKSIKSELTNNSKRFIWKRARKLILVDHAQGFSHSESVCSNQSLQREEDSYQWKMNKNQLRVFSGIPYSLFVVLIQLWGSRWLKSRQEGFPRSTIPSLCSPWSSRPSLLVWWGGRRGWRGSRGTARRRRRAATGRRRRRWGWWTGSSSWWEGNQSLLASYSESSSSKILSAAEQLIVRLWLLTCPSTPPPPATQVEFHLPPPASPPPLPQAFLPPQNRLHFSIPCCLHEPPWRTTWQATISTNKVLESLPVRVFLLLLRNLFLITRSTMTGGYSSLTVVPGLKISPIPSII